MKFYSLNARASVLLALLFPLAAHVAAQAPQPRPSRNTNQIQQAPLDEVVPSEAYVHIQQGNRLMSAERVDEAIAEYRAALQKSAKPLFTVYMNLGAAYLQKRDYKEATENYRRAVLMRPASMVAHLHLGDSLFADGKLAEAEAEYRKAIALSPRGLNSTAHHFLGLSLYGQQRADEAIAEYRLAIEQAHDDYAEAHYNLGIALLFKQSYKEAEQQFRISIAQAKRDWPDAYFNLAVALERQKRFREAADAFETYLRQSPDAADAATIRASIERLRKQP